MGSKNKEKKEHKHKKEKKKKDKDRKRHHSDDSPHASPERAERDSGSKHHKKRHKHSKDDVTSGKTPKHASRDERRDESRDRHKSHHRDRDHQHIEVEEVVEYTTTEEVAKPQRMKAPGVPDYVKQEEEIVDNDDDNTGKSRDSLSIDETNKLRAKLGLKPLDIPSAGGEGVDEAEKDFVHKPAENLWKKQKEQKLREKFLLTKEKRKQQAKLLKMKTLGEEDDVDDISNWVKNSRKEEERSKREIEVMSAASEFGIDVKGKSAHDNKRSYSGRDLQGIEIEHDLSTFKDGRSEILVIKDKDILDEDPEDVLHSVVLDDVEKSKRNLEIKRKGFGYKAFEEEEVDEMGFFKPKTVLGKYDEEIEGETKGKFKIGASGTIDTTWEQQKEKMKQQIRARGETLELPKLKLASDYLTAAEIGFKKRKKRVRKIRKRETFKADDLEPLPGDVTISANDHGSRVKQEEEDVKSRRDDVIEDIDDANDELERALAKTRKMKRKEKQDQQEDNKEDKNSKDDVRKIAEMVRKEAEVERENEKDRKNMFSLNTTDEFCRKLGSQLLAMESKPAVTSQQDVIGGADDVMIHHDDMEIDDDMDMDGEMAVGDGGDDVKMEHDDDDDVPSSSGISSGGKISSQWRDVNDANGGGMDEGEDHVAIEAEPIAGKGLIGALKLARRKGYIATESAPKGNTIITTNMSTLKAQNYSIEDKNAVDYLDKYAHEKYSKDRNARHERSGMTMEFNEKKDYKPKIGLIYVDELGRNQSPKEAFRKLSHRFHGKGSGKMKQEKRMKKFAEEDAMRHMNSTDTPLNTVAMMTEKQRSQSTPYIVLSGGGKTFMSGASTNADISKK